MKMELLYLAMGFCCAAFAIGFFYAAGRVSAQPTAPFPNFRGRATVLVSGEPIGQVDEAFTDPISVPAEWSRERRQGWKPVFLAGQVRTAENGLWWRP